MKARQTDDLEVEIDDERPEGVPVKHACESADEPISGRRDWGRDQVDLGT